MTHPNCPVCGATDLEQRRETRRVKFEGAPITYEAEYLFCSECEAETVTPAQTRRNKRALVAAKGAHLGVASPEELRRWRAKWQLTQQEAGRLLGVGKSAFSKYENSALLPSAPTTRLIDAVMYSDTAVHALAKKYQVAITKRPALSSLNATSVSSEPSMKWLMQHHLILATTPTSPVKSSRVKIAATLFTATVSPDPLIVTGWSETSSRRSSIVHKTAAGATHVSYH